MNRSILSLTALLSLFCIPLRAANDPCIFNPKAIQEFGPSDGMLNPRWVEYSPDGKVCVVANFGTNVNSANGTVQIYKVYSNGTLKLKTTLTNAANGIHTPLAARFAPQKNSDCGYCLAVANHDLTSGGQPSIQIYSVDPQHYSATLTQQIATTDSPFSMAFSPDGTCLVVGDIRSNIISYAFDTRTCTANTEYVSKVGMGIKPRSLAFSRNGNCLAVAGPTSGLATYPMNSCTIMDSPSTYTTAQKSVTFAQFNPCGNCLAVTSNNISLGSIDIYSFNELTCTATTSQTINFTSTSDVPRQVAFSPDGSCLAVAHFGDPFSSPKVPGTQVTIYPFNKNACTADENNATTLAVDTPYALTFSPNGNTLAVASSDTGGFSLFDVSSYLRIFKTRKCVNICEPVVCP